jgi:transposase-like protein
MSSEAPVRRREDWQQLIAEYRESGLTVKAFCQKHAVSEALFYSWRKRVVAEDPPA